jgi:hypothetical protein
MIIDYAHFVMLFLLTLLLTQMEILDHLVYLLDSIGAALMYDETFECFKWLFETFSFCHNHKQPRTIYTDQDSAMGKAIAVVFSESWHGLWAWHKLQNAIKQLRRLRNDDSKGKSYEVCLLIILKILML